MAKQSKPRTEEKHRRRVFGLEFLGSVIYIVALFTALYGSYALGTLGKSVWQSTFFAIAGIGALSLFVLAFMNLLEIQKSTTVAAMFVTIIVSVSLISLTFANLSFAFVILIGLIFSFSGTGIAHHAHTKLSSSGKRINEDKKLRVFGFQFLGSVIALLIAFTAIGLAATLPASQWQPILCGFALTGATALFLLAFLNFGVAKELTTGVLLLGLITGVSLLGLTLGSIIFFLVSIIGFVLMLSGAFILMKE